MKLKLDRSPTESRSDEVPQSPIETVALAASLRVEELEKENESLKRQLRGLANKLSDAKQEANEARGKLSEYVLTSGGKALLDAPDILAGINDVKAMLDRQAQWMTAYGLRVDTEREDRTFLAEQDALGRVPV